MESFLIQRSIKKKIPLYTLDSYLLKIVFSTKLIYFYSNKIRFFNQLNFIVDQVYFPFPGMLGQAPPPLSHRLQTHTGRPRYSHLPVPQFWNLQLEIQAP